MTDSPIDFSPLEPGDDTRWRALAGRIEGAAKGELRRRREARLTAQVVLLHRARPLLAAAALVAAVAGASLYRTAGAAADPSASALAALAGVPYEAALGVATGRPTLLGQLVLPEAP